MPKSKAGVTFCWHVHHNILLEPLTEPLKNRIAYIKDNKPEDEIATRLRLLKPVVGGLPTAVAEAGKAYDAAWEAYDDEAGEAYDAAWEAYIEAREAYDAAREAYIEAGEAYIEAQKAYIEALKIHEAEILALHAIECPNCPWDKEQHTIFPEVTNGNAVSQER